MSLNPRDISSNFRLRGTGTKIMSTTVFDLKIKGKGKEYYISFRKGRIDYLVDSSSEFLINYLNR